LGGSPGGAVLFDSGVESVEVEPDVDPQGGEDGHAAAVVGIGGDMVDTDGVGAYGGHEGCVGVALGYINEGVGGGALVGDA